MSSQLSLPLNFPEISHDQPLLPVRMVNEFVYCARLAYLEWVQGEWRESVDTVQGAHARRISRADSPTWDAKQLHADRDWHTHLYG